MPATNRGGAIVTDDAWVRVHACRDLIDALLARVRLESSGIEVLLFDEHMIRLDWFLSYALRGVKVMVREADAEAAAEILAAPPAVTTDFPCPRCESAEVEYLIHRRLLSLFFLFLRIPLPWKKRWLCRKCRLKW